MADSTLKSATPAPLAPLVRLAPPALSLAAAALSTVALATVTPASPARAATPSKQEVISLDAQSSELDLRSNNVVFRKVRIAQGTMAVSADQGQATRQASGLNFDNSVWVFRGNVKITMDQGQLTADTAEINFADKLLASAVASGKPAQFEQRQIKTGKLAEGRAETIDYDARRGVVRLLKNAWLSDGQNEIRGESLKYNVLAQSIVAEAAEQGSKRVHIVITPPPPKP